MSFLSKFFLKANFSQLGPILIDPLESIAASLATIVWYWFIFVVVTMIGCCFMWTAGAKASDALMGGRAAMPKSVNVISIV